MEFFTYFFLSFLSWALFWEWRGVGFSGSSLKRERTERYEVYPFPAKNDILIRTWGYFRLLVLFFYGLGAFLVLCLLVRHGNGRLLFGIGV